MAIFFWVGVLVVLGVVIGYAARADARARRKGLVLIPVKQGFGRRTRFVAVDKTEVEQRRVEAELTKREAAKLRRSEETGYLSLGKLFRPGGR